MTQLPIRLESQFKDTTTWEEALVRLEVAVEAFEGFPVAITMDETAEVWASFNHYHEFHDDEEAYNAHASYWDDYAVTVYNWEEAKRAIYPWFHEGEEMPKWSGSPCPDDPDLGPDPLGDWHGRNI